MVYLEKVERNDKTYYYITKQFRLSNNKWKKIRRYIGDKPPSKEQKNMAIKEIEIKALQKGIISSQSDYSYLTNEEAEKLQDTKAVFNKFYGKLDVVGRKKYDDDFIVRFTYNSNAIEGNRLSLRETSMILNDDIIPAGSTTNDFYETLNSKDCYEFLKKYSGEFNKTFLLRIHKILTKNTNCRIKGNYRDNRAIINGSEWVPPPPEEIEALMKKVFYWYYNNKKKLHPIELGSVLHNKLVRIHPFTDGNGRTSRVIANWILMKNKFPMFTIDLRDKINYYNAIEEGDKGNDGELVHYLTKVLIEQHTFVSK